MMAGRTLRTRMKDTRSHADHPTPKPRGRWRERTISLVLLAVVAVLLGVALRLDPSPEGVGTHRQLGLAPCGFLAATSLPCATCGMTTAYTHAVHGHILTALTTQPGGMVMAVMTAAAGILSLYTLAMGLSLGPVARWLWQPALFWLFAGLMITSWVYKSLAIYMGTLA